jgi:ABC-2 type transport system ATP-binding protein
VCWERKPPSTCSGVFNMFMPKGARSAPECAIAVRGLSKRFGHRVAIDDLTLSVRSGDICGLAGANGGGKSTSLRLLAGLLAPDRGEGFVLGCDLVRGARQVRHEVGYLAQRGALYPTLSVRENLRFRAAMFGLSHPVRAADVQIAAFGFTEFAAVPVDQLSGGWCRQVELAATLIHRPRVLLLDEPTAGLDPAARQAIWRRLISLAAQGAAIVLSTHDFVEAQRCAHILLLSEGRIRASGSPHEVAAQCDALALIVSGPGVLSLPDRLQSRLVLAVHPMGNDIRLVVSADARGRVEALIASQGCRSTATSLTLEDAALVVAHRGGALL